MKKFSALFMIIVMVLSMVPGVFGLDFHVLADKEIEFSDSQLNELTPLKDTYVDGKIVHSYPGLFGTKYYTFHSDDSGGVYVSEIKKEGDTYTSETSEGKPYVKELTQDNPGWFTGSTPLTKTKLQSTKVDFSSQPAPEPTVTPTKTPTDTTTPPPADSATPTDTTTPEPADSATTTEPTDPTKPKPVGGDGVAKEPTGTPVPIDMDTGKPATSSTTVTAPAPKPELLPTFQKKLGLSGDDLIGKMTSGSTMTVSGKTYTVLSAVKLSDEKIELSVRQEDGSIKKFKAKASIDPTSSYTLYDEKGDAAGNVVARDVVVKERETQTATTVSAGAKRTTTPSVKKEVTVAIQNLDDGDIITLRDGTQVRIRDDGNGRRTAINIKGEPTTRVVNEALLSGAKPAYEGLGSDPTFLGYGDEIKLGLDTNEEKTFAIHEAIRDVNGKVIAYYAYEIINGVRQPSPREVSVKQIVDGKGVAVVKDPKDILTGAPATTDPRDGLVATGGAPLRSNHAALSDILGGGIDQQVLSSALNDLNTYNDNLATRNDIIESTNELIILLKQQLVTAQGTSAEAIRAQIASEEGKLISVNAHLDKMQESIKATFPDNKDGTNAYFTIGDKGELIITNPSVVKDIQERVARSKNVPGNKGLYFDPETNEYFKVDDEPPGITTGVTHTGNSQFKVDLERIGLAYDSANGGCLSSSTSGKCLKTGDSVTVSDKDGNKRPFDVLSSEKGGNTVLYSEGGFFDSTKVTVTDKDGKIMTKSYDAETEEILERQVRYEDAVRDALSDLEFDDDGKITGNDKKLNFEGTQLDIKFILEQAQSGFRNEVTNVLNARNNYLPSDLRDPKYLKVYDYEDKDGNTVKITSDLINKALEGNLDAIAKVEKSGVLPYFTDLDDIRELRAETDLSVLRDKGVIGEMDYRDMVEDWGKELPEGTHIDNGIVLDKNGKPVKLSPEQAAAKAKRESQRKSDKAGLITVRETPGLKQLLLGIGFMRALVNVGNKFNGLGAVASLFIEDDDIYGVKDEVHQAFCDSVLFGDESCRAQAFCEISPDHITGGSAVLIGGAPESFKASAHIEAYVYPPYIDSSVSETGRTKYRLERLYQVTYSVSLGPEEQDSYNVVFKGQLGDNRMFTSDQAIAKGGSEARGRRNPYIQYSTNLYEEICITFGKGIEDYTGKRHKSLCAPIVEKTGRAPGPVKKKADTKTKTRGENPNL